MRHSKRGTTADRSGRRRSHRLGLVTVLAVVLLVAAACRPDSGTISPVRAADGALIGVDGAHSAGGIMGVDIMLGPDEYNPCHLHYDTQDGTPYNDRYYGACQDSDTGRTSYYRHVAYSAGGPQLAGVLFGGADWNRCNAKPWCNDNSQLLLHGWSDKATAWALEFYPSTGGEGGVRIQGRFDQRTFGNQAFSGPVGAMRPITDATPGSFRLAVDVHGGPWADRRFEVDAFQMPPWSMLTSAMYPEQGFAVLVNTGGTMRSWPMVPGTYKLYVTDNATGASTIVYRDLGPGSVLDLRPGQACFGLAGGLDPRSEQPVC